MRVLRAINRFFLRKYVTIIGDVVGISFGVSSAFLLAKGYPVSLACGLFILGAIITVAVIVLLDLIKPKENH